MGIWVLFALMTGAAVVAVLWPLARRPVTVSDDGIDAKFYRDQIAEIERDRGRGLLSPAEADAAKVEAGRRLLRASAIGVPSNEVMGEPALRRRRAASAVALSVVPLLALAVYGAFGSPQLPAQPLSARLKDDPRQLDVAAAVARVEAHLAAHPEDGRGWEVVAPVYLRSGRVDDAAKAYEAAIRLLGESAPRLTNYGEVLVAAKDGIVSIDARKAFERALQIDSSAAKASFYLARAAEQDGDHAKARAHYADILSRAPADAPWTALVRERMASLPAADAAQALVSLPAEDRQTAIRGMVDGLAARLEGGGGTPDEWSRLVRSYAVLGERDKAKSALDKARQALAATGPQASLDTLARELRLEPGEPKR
jgi:cytochrome c-type biogenesis protein CcmH